MIKDWPTSGTRKPPMIFLPRGMVMFHTTRLSSGRTDFSCTKNLLRFSLYSGTHLRLYLSSKTEKGLICSQSWHVYTTQSCEVAIVYSYVHFFLTLGQFLPGYIPNTGIDNNHVWLHSLTEICKYAPHVVREDPCDKIEPDQVMVRAILSNLSVLCAIVHMA